MLPFCGPTNRALAASKAITMKAVVRCSFSALLLLALPAPVLAASVKVHVVNADGAALKGALVIVQALQDGQERELCRELTSASGEIALPNLQPGLYRAIAADPYRSWTTEVREFLVKNQPLNLELKLAARATDDPVIAAVGRLTVHVLDSAGNPASGAHVLLRDAEARTGAEHWGITNASGTTSVEVTANSAVLVIVYRDQLYTFPANSIDTQRTVRLAPRGS
jgi:5-hydroxyisourate hydrolase-like protein (transthyretin family)